MAVSNTSSRKVTYTGNGATTTYAVSFPFFEIEVYLDDVLVDPADYTTTQVAPGNTGDVVFNTAPAASVEVDIIGKTRAVQETDYTENDPFPANTHESALDRLTMFVQELDSRLSSQTLGVAFEDPALPVLDLAGNPDSMFVTDGSGVPTLSPLATVLAADIAAAEAARDAAEGFRDGAETHKNSAQTAQTASDAARDASVAAQLLSEAARDLSQTYRDQAETFKNAALAASENLAWGYTFDSATAKADPTAGKYRFNHATFGSITEMYISKDADEGDIGTLIETWDNSTSTLKGRLKVRNPLSPTQWMELYVSGTIVDEGDYYTVPVQPIASNAAITDATGVILMVTTSGDAGTGAVNSFNGRTGAVSPAASDYDASQVDNDSGVTGATVALALDQLNSAKASLAGGNTFTGDQFFDTDLVRQDSRGLNAHTYHRIYTDVGRIAGFVFYDGGSAKWWYYKDGSNQLIAYNSQAGTVCYKGLPAENVIEFAERPRHDADPLAIEGEVAGVNTQTGTAYTLDITDKGKVVEMNNASANTLTVPPNADEAFAVKTRIDIVQYGAGQTTIAAGSGVTIRSKDSNLKISAQYGAASLYKRGTNEWVLIGDLEA